MTQVAHILLVDDSEDAREIALAALAEGEFDVVKAAASAEQAYELLGLDGDPDEPPAYDLVLLDIVMPGVDGVEACARIRSSRRYRDIPILMVSGQSDVEVLNQAFVAGANDYVTKPINPIELLARVRSSLRFKREIDRRHAREAELRAQASGKAPAKTYRIDEAIGLPDREAVDAHIRAAADGGLGTALLLLTVDSLVAYRAENGPVAAEQLLRRLGREFGMLNAPLAATLGYFGDGQFLVVAPGTTGALLHAMAEDAHRRLAALQLAHGSSPDHDHVRVSTVVGEARAEALLRLPSHMIASGEEAMRNGGNQAISIGSE